MRILVNTSTDLFVVIDKFEAKKKIEKVIVRTQFNAKGELEVVGAGTITDPDAKRDVLYHTFRFGVLTDYNQSNVISKAIDLAKSQLPSSFVEPAENN
jgi:hypothetical protein